MNYEQLDSESVLGQALLDPNRRISASQIPKIEEELIELEGVPIEPEYWKNNTQYNPLIHAYEKTKPHIVLKGRNVFDFQIYKRTGKGKLELVNPGEKFITHALVNLNN